MKKILIVDDEKHIVEFLEINLKRQGYETIASLNSEAVQEIAIIERPDCILLDIMMPVINGYEVCRRLKEDIRTQDIPVIMLTAKSDESDSILGLGIGADDYIVKPFSIKVLFARIEALLRRYKNDFTNEEIIIGDTKIDERNSQVLINNDFISLTPNEMRILILLIENKNQLVTREEMLDKIDSDSSEINSRTVDVHISGIRKKVKDSELNIRSVRGKGYILNV